MPFDMGHPYIRRHVEGHLVFGPLSRGDPVRPVVASVIVAGFVAGYGLMAPILFLQGKDDAWAALFLGLVWLPGVEFIPWVLPRQKYVTAARILLFYLWLLGYAVNSPG